MPIDPIRLSKIIQQTFCDVDHGVYIRRYWRFRGGKWYGGVATADCTGCNLRCIFCGPVLCMSKKRTKGNFKTPEEVVKILLSIARKGRYRYIRISGGEPTICIEHLFQVLECFMQHDADYIFILETNGILIGADKNIAERLSQYKNIHVRVSLKGTNSEEFETLTMADRKFFDMQITALKNLLDYEISFHPAVVASFTTDENIEKLIDNLGRIDPYLAQSLEVEYIVLYPHVVESLNKHNIVPTKAFTTNWTLIGAAEYIKTYRKTQ